MPLTNEEIICTWMMNGKRFGYPWWVVTNDGHLLPGPLTLDALREVQERLSQEQWIGYCASFSVQNIPLESTPNNLQSVGELVMWDKAHLHASAKQKIDALAAVLRPEVERACGEELTAREWRGHFPVCPGRDQSTTGAVAGDDRARNQRRPDACGHCQGFGDQPMTHAEEFENFVCSEEMDPSELCHRCHDYPCVCTVDDLMLHDDWDAEIDAQRIRNSESPTPGCGTRWSATPAPGDWLGNHRML